MVFSSQKLHFSICFSGAKIHFSNKLAKSFLDIYVNTNKSIIVFHNTIYMDDVSWPVKTTQGFSAGFVYVRAKRKAVLRPPFRTPGGSRNICFIFSISEFCSRLKCWYLTSDKTWLGFIRNQYSGSFWIHFGYIGLLGEGKFG